MKLNYEIWLPQLEFMLQTISINYPKHPNDVTKKKYYNFIQDLPLLFPDEPIGNNFIELLDKYPVTPYLGSRLSFMKWVHFIFNKIKMDLNKETIDFNESLNRYYKEYEPKEIKEVSYLKQRKKYVLFAFSIILISGIIYLYNKD